MEFLPVKITVTHWDGEECTGSQCFQHGLCGMVVLQERYGIADVFISNDGRNTHSWSESSTLRRGCPVLNRIWDSR